MANIVWNGTGGVNGKLTDNANWDGGTAPAGSDVGVFNQGSQDVDPSLGDIAALGGLEIYPGYGGNIGASGNKMTSSIDTVKHLGRAALWLDDSAGTTDDVYIRRVSNNVIVNLGGDTMTNVTILRGNVTLDGGIGVIALLEVGFVENQQGDVVLTVVNNANAITAMRQWGGNATCNKTITDHRISAGVMTLPVGTSGQLTNIYQSGGNVYHYTTNTITLFHIGPGTLDLGQAAKTITNSVRYPGGRIIRQADTIHTFTNPMVDLADAA